MHNLEQVNCNLCGNPEYNVIYKARYELEKDEDYSVKFRSSGDEVLINQLVECTKCGLIYINPRITSDTIIKAYSEGEDETFVSQIQGREITFNKCLIKIEKYCSKPGKILDIGTAAGSFLHVAKKRGWDVFGCEPSKWLCEWCQKNYGIAINPGTVYDQKYSNESFDVITLWDVLEHTPDPKSILNECYRILKKGGLLVINYPDIGSWISRLMGRKWVFLLSVHLYYFNRKTIKSILEDTGFTVMKIKPHYQELAIGYIFRRAKPYIGVIASFGESMCKRSGLYNKNIPYWMGQTLVITKKG